MARTVTIAEAVTEVRNLADVDSDPHITDAMIISWLSRWWAELHEILVASGLYFVEDSCTVTTVGSNGLYPLATDVLSVLRVDYIRPDGTPEELVEVPVRDVPRVSLPGTTGSRSFYYRHVGGNIVLYPTPPDGQQYVITYTPTAPDLTAMETTEEIDGISGWEEYPICGAVLYVLQRQERSTEVMERRLQQVRARVVVAAQNRAIASATSLVEGRPSRMGLPLEGSWEWWR